MHAIEVLGKINEAGQLILNRPLSPVNQSVKVIVLFEEESLSSDSTWLQSLATNPAFSFLAEPEEDIYTLADGKPFQ